MSRNLLNQTSRPSAIARRIGQACALLAVIVFTCSIGAEDTRAQFDGGGGGIGGGVPVDGGGNVGGDFAGNDAGNIGNDGGNDGGNFGDDAGFGEVLGGAATSDQRNQGFVGSTGTQIQESGFVGPPGETTGPPLADGANFGGGVNDVSLANGGGGGNNAARGNNRNTGFGITGQQGIVKGFEVLRSSVRANLRPQFASPTVTPVQIQNRFQQTIRRLPSMTTDGNGVTISIVGTTATITGVVGSESESNRIQRQLRLQPGVYRIDNQTQVINQ